MQNEESTLAWILFWLFAVITTVAAFLIVDHHRSRLFALGMTTLSVAFFIGLYLALQALLRYLGL
jgi:hypothetical protein